MGVVDHEFVKAEMLLAIFLFPSFLPFFFSFFFLCNV